MSGQIPIGKLKNDKQGGNFPNVEDQNSRLVTYSLSGSSINYFLNTDFQISQSNKIGNHIKTRLLFEGFLAVYKDILRIRSEFDKFASDLKKCIDESSQNILINLKYYQDEEIKGSKLLKELSREETSSDFHDYLVKMASGLIITVFSKYQKLVMLRNTREYEKERIGKYYEAKKFVEGGKYILDILNKEEQLINIGEFGYIIADYDKECSKITQVDEYIKSIEENGNYLESGEGIEENYILHYYNILLKFFDQFSGIYERLMILSADLFFNRDKINYIQRIWDTRINLEKESIARKFYLTEIKYLSLKIESCNLIGLIYENYSKINTLENCFNCLNNSILECDRVLRTAQIGGSLHASNQNSRGYFGCGHTYEYTTTKVTHSFHIIKENIAKITNNPTMFITHQRTSLAIDTSLRLMEDLKKASQESLEYDKYYSEYKKLNDEYEEFLNLRSNQINEKRQELATTLEGYNGLMDELKKKDFSIDDQIIIPWFGVLFKNCSIRKSAKFEAYDRESFSAVNLNPNKLYSIFFYNLLGKGNVNKEGCILSLHKMLDQINQCKLITFEDLRELIYNPMIYGCLKNNQGQSQEFNNYVRTEDVSKSLFSLINETMEIMVCHKMIKLDLNKDYNYQKLDVLSDLYVNTLESNGFRKHSTQIKQSKEFKNFKKK